MSNMLLDRKIIEKFLIYWEKNGFQRSNSATIIPFSNWKHTLFVNSGLINHLSLIDRFGSLISSVCLCQPCIKAGTSYFSLENMVLKDGYFTFFEQLSCGGNQEIPVSWFIEKIWSYLVETMGLSAKKIFIGIPDSYSDFVQNWIQTGVPMGNILCPDPQAFKFELKGGQVSGSYNSIYYDRKDSCGFVCEENICDINCSCGRFLEIGDVGIIYSGKERIIDHGIGLERLLSVVQKLSKVTDIEEIQVILTILRGVGIREECQLSIIADHLRTVLMILSLGIKPGNKGRGYVARLLLRRVFWKAYKSGFSTKFANGDIYRNILPILEKRLSEKVLSDKEVISEIKKEYIKFKILVERGSDIIKKMKRKTSVFSDSSAEFIYKTYGLPREIAENLFYLEDKLF